MALELVENADVLPLILELLTHPAVSNSADELLERELLGLVYQLSKTAEGARAVESAGAAPALMDCLRSEHKSVRTEDSELMIRFRGSGFRVRRSKNLRKS